jgi:ribosomal protein S1
MGVKSAAEVVREGDQAEAKVLEIDRRRGRSA